MAEYIAVEKDRRRSYFRSAAVANQKTKSTTGTFNRDTMDFEPVDYTESEEYKEYLKEVCLFIAEKRSLKFREFPVEIKKHRTFLFYDVLKDLRDQGKIIIDESKPISLIKIKQ